MKFLKMLHEGNFFYSIIIENYSWFFVLESINIFIIFMDNRVSYIWKIYDIDL